MPTLQHTYALCLLIPVLMVTLAMIRTDWVVVKMALPFSSPHALSHVSGTVDCRGSPGGWNVATMTLSVKTLATPYLTAATLNCSESPWLVSTPPLVDTLARAQSSWAQEPLY